MRRPHAIALSLLLGVGCAAGIAAATRTVHLGAATAAATAPTVPRAVLASRRTKLEAWSVSLQKTRTARPPALPRLPRFAPVVVPTVSVRHPAGTAAAPTSHIVVHRIVHHVVVRPTPPAATQPITYVQPPPIVQYAQPPATTTAASGTGSEGSDDEQQQGGDPGDQASGGGGDDSGGDDGGDG
jgi:uncharacterized membrane protein YgcG